MAQAMAVATVKEEKEKAEAENDQAAIAAVVSATFQVNAVKIVASAGGSFEVRYQISITRSLKIV